jgi:hypothetical protein
VVDDEHLYWLFLWLQSKPELLLQRSEEGRAIRVTIAGKLSGDIERQIGESGLENALFNFIGGPAQCEVIGPVKPVPSLMGRPRRPASGTTVNAVCTMAGSSHESAACFVRFDGCASKAGVWALAKVAPARQKSRWRAKRTGCEEPVHL